MFILNNNKAMQQRSNTIRQGEETVQCNDTTTQGEASEDRNLIVFVIVIVRQGNSAIQ